MPEHPTPCRDLELHRESVAKDVAHLQTENAKMWEVIDKVRDRIPVWAVFLLSGALSIATLFATLYATAGHK